MSSDTPVNSCTSSSGEKRKRHLLNLQQKLEICRRIESGVNRKVLMKDYNISSSTLYDIRSRRHKYLKFLDDSLCKTSIGERKKLSKPKLEQLDGLLYEWYKMETSKGVNVTGNMLIERAKDFYQQLQLKERVNFSAGWLHGFKRRHGIRKQGNKPGIVVHPINSGTESEHREVFSFLNDESGLTSEEVYYAGEAELLWRVLPHSADGEEAVTNSFIKSEDRLTVLACSNTAGTHKLKLVVVGKYNCPRAFKGTGNASLKYVKDEDSRMNGNIVKEWFHDSFVLEVKRELKSKGKPEDSKVVLLLDESRNPPCDMISGHIFTKFVPLNASSEINSTIQGILRSLTHYYRTDLSKRLENYAGTVEDFLCALNIKDALLSISWAWDMVRKEILQRDWKNICPSQCEINSSVIETRDETNNDSAYYMDDESEMIEMDPSEGSLATDVAEKMKCNLLTSTISDEDNLVECVLGEVKTEVLDDEEFQGDNYEEEEIVSWDEADEALQKFLKFAENSKSYSGLEMMQLKVIRLDFIQKRQNHWDK